MQVSDIIRRAAGLLGIEYADVLADAGLLVDFIGYVNDALKTIEDRGDWRWLMVEADIASTANRDWLVLPEDFKALQVQHQVFYIDQTYYFPRAVSPEELGRLRSVSTAAGRPYYYSPIFEPALQQWRLIFWPAPEAVITFRVPYRRLIKRVVEIGEIPQLPIDMHTTLLLGTMAEAEEQRERVPAGSQRAKFMAMLESDWKNGSSPLRDHRPGTLRRLDEATRRHEQYGGQISTIVRVDTPGT